MSRLTTLKRYIPPSREDNAKVMRARSLPYVLHVDSAIIAFTVLHPPNKSALIWHMINDI